MGQAGPLYNVHQPRLPPDASKLEFDPATPEYYLEGKYSVAHTPQQHFALSHDAIAISGKGAGSGDGAWGSGAAGGKAERQKAWMEAQDQQQKA